MIGVGCESVLSFLLAIISVVAMLPYFTSYAGRKLKIRKQRKIMKDKLMTIATKLGSSLESKLYSKYKIAPTLPYLKTSRSNYSKRFYRNSKSQHIGSKSTKIRYLLSAMVILHQTPMFQASNEYV